MPLFCFQLGLTGCYLPDSSQNVMIRSKRNLLAAVLDEVENIQESGGVVSIKEVLSFVDQAWKDRKIVRILRLHYHDTNGEKSPYSLTIHTGVRE